MYVIHIVLAVAEMVMLEVQGTPVSLSNVFAHILYVTYGRIAKEKYRICILSSAYFGYYW